MGGSHGTRLTGQLQLLSRERPSVYDKINNVSLRLSTQK